MIFGLSLSKTLVHILTEAWWFDTVGFSEVFWTRLTWQILIWIVKWIPWCAGTCQITVLLHHKLVKCPSCIIFFSSPNFQSLKPQNTEYSRGETNY
ncbi:UPF0182 family protein [Trichormus variabilis]|uniref:UPF0182 family protein n=1 Tax=Anabaena variabilis TaxID=264691 RepID=UPI003D2E462B